MPEPTPPAGSETPPADPPADPPAPVAGADEFDKDRAMATIRTLREEVKQAKAAAKDAADLKDRLDAIEAEKLTEQERIQKERDEAMERNRALEATNRENAVKLAVFSAQQEKGLADADLALAALDRTKIEFGADGQPTNVGELLDDLLERKPLLKQGPPKPPPVPPTDGGGGTGGGDAPALTADELDAAAALGVTPEQYAANKAAMKGGTTVSVKDLIAAKKG